MSISAVTAWPTAQPRQVCPSQGQVQDLPGRGAFAGVGDGQHGAISPAQLARIARLAAALGIEHGAVELDAGFADGRDRGGALGQRGVFAEEFFGHGGCGWLAGGGATGV